MDMKITLVIALVLTFILLTGFGIVNSKGIRHIFEFLFRLKGTKNKEIVNDGMVKKIKEFINTISFETLKDYFTKIQDTKGKEYYVLSRIPILHNDDRVIQVYMIGAEWARSNMSYVSPENEIPIETKLVSLSFPSESGLTEESTNILFANDKIPKTKKGSDYLSDIRTFCKSQCILDCQDCVLSKYKRNTTRTAKKS